MSLFERSLPLRFEPVSVPPSDIIVPDSDDDDEDTYRHPAKRRRVEEIGRRYMCGQPIEIFSARLKGPFGNDWVNPWARQRTAGRSAYRSSNREKTYQKAEGPKDRLERAIDPGSAHETKSRSRSVIGKARVKDDPQPVTDAEKPRKATRKDVPGGDRATKGAPRHVNQPDHGRKVTERAANGDAARASLSQDEPGNYFRAQEDEDMMDDEVKGETGHDPLRVNGAQPLVDSELKDACSKIVSTTTDASAINPQPTDAGGYTRVLLPTDSAKSESGGHVRTGSEDGDEENVPPPHQAAGFEGDMVVSVQEIDLRETDEETRDAFQQAKALSHFAASQGSRGTSGHPSRAPSTAAFLPSPVEISNETPVGERAGLKEAWSFTGPRPSRKNTSEQFSMSQPATSRTRPKRESDAQDGQRPRSSPLKSPPHSLHTLQPSRTSFGTSIKSLPSAPKGTAASVLNRDATKPEPPVQIDVPRTQPSTPESPVRPPLPDSSPSSPRGDGHGTIKDHVTIITPRRAPRSPLAPAASDRRTPSAEARTTKKEEGGIDTQTLFDAVSPGALHAIKKTYRSSRVPRRPSTAKTDNEHDVGRPSTRAGSNGPRSPVKARPQPSRETTSVLKRPARGARQKHPTTPGSPSKGNAAAPDRPGEGEGEELNAVIDEMMGGVLDPWDVETELKKEASRRRSTNTARAGAVRTR